MSILDIIKTRRSTRKYKQTPIPEDVFLRVIEAARLAPSGKNFQPWKFIIVKKQALKEKLAEASRGQKFIAQAAVVIVACAYPEQRCWR